MGLSSWYHRESLGKQLDAFQKLIGIPAPKALIKQVAEWDAEIDAVAKAVSTETKKVQK